MAYIISLAIVVASSQIIDAEQLSRISFAITVAGLFFALSDYLSFIANDKKESVENVKKRIAIKRNHLNEMYLAFVDNEKEAKRYLELFKEKSEILDDATLLLNNSKEALAEINELNIELDEIEFMLKKDEEESSKKEEKSNFYLCLGFIFALVIVFLQINIDHTVKFSNIATIISFGIITSTYLLKDFMEDSKKIEMEQVKEAEYFFNNSKQEINKNKEITQILKQRLDKYESENIVLKNTAGAQDERR